MLKIEVHSRDDAQILRLEGELSLKSVEELEQRFAECDAAAPLVLDVTALTRINPGGFAPVRQEATRRLAGNNSPLFAGHGTLPEAMSDGLQAPTVATLCHELSIGKVIKLFDHVFTRTLTAWHDASQFEELRIYDELLHSAEGLGELARSAAQKAGIDPTIELLECGELEQDLPNPFHFAAEKLPVLTDEMRAWPVCVCHNQLTLDTIRFAEPDFVLMTNLHEARPGSATTDLAHMEPDLLVRMTRLEDERDLRDLARFMDKWFDAITLRDIPRHQYSGTDLMVIKAFEVMRRLRAHADTLAGESAPATQHDMKLYLVAVLERALDLIAHANLNQSQLRAATLLAALVSRRILY